MASSPSGKKGARYALVVSLKTAAGGFGEPQDVEPEGWLELPGGVKAPKGTFVAQVGGPHDKIESDDFPWDGLMGSQPLPHHGCMAYSLDGKLIIGITSRALFDLAEANSVFESDGIDAYRAYQREREDTPLAPGTAFPLVRGLLKINDLAGEHLVEVVVMSRNDPDSGTRIFRSAEAHGLDVTRGAFTDGKEVWPYLKPFNVTLFLSAEESQVKRAIVEKYPAALVLRPPEHLEEDVDEVRIAFDGDAVLFDDESERVFQAEGLEAFLAREKELADVPMNPGPFEPFLRALHRIQSKFSQEKSPIRIALVTARNAPADRRVINTLRHWGIRVDDSFFLGGIAKAGVLEALKPHIFFDDQMIHLEPAAQSVSAAHVLYGKAHQPELFDTVDPP